jgi:hypothetical protein
VSLGERLFAVVREYASLGEHHRTGTPEDERTLQWFERHLAALGATSIRQSWAFDRYDAQWRVVVDGADVAALPLYYEGVAHKVASRPYVASVEAVPGGTFAGWADVTKRARDCGASLIVAATESPSGLLVAPNRAPSPPGSGLPTLLVAGALSATLPAADVSASLTARLLSERAANVMARLGAGRDDQRLLLTTPLSGWFRCAGERGTGIAIMLAVAEQLAADGIPLMLNGNSGHELVDLGAHHFAAARPGVRGIFHFGASVAAGAPDGSGGLRLTDGLRIRAWIPARETALTTAFEPLGKTPTFISDAEHTHPDAWVGEGRAWCTLDRPLVSMAGHFPLFHTSDDVPERATTPALLERSYHAALAAARVLSR